MGAQRDDPGLYCLLKSMVDRRSLQFTLKTEEEKIIKADMKSMVP